MTTYDHSRKLLGFNLYLRLKYSETKYEKQLKQQVLFHSFPHKYLHSLYATPSVSHHLPSNLPQLSASCSLLSHPPPPFSFHLCNYQAVFSSTLQLSLPPTLTSCLSLESITEQSYCLPLDHLDLFHKLCSKYATIYCLSNTIETTLD